MTNIRYAACTTTDIDAVLAFWDSTTHGGSSNTPEAIAIYLEFESELFILAWDGDELVGTLMGAWDGWRGSFYRLAVHAGHRRLGIGKELVGRVEKQLAKRGARRVYANVLADSEEGFDFWRSAGFTPNDAIEAYAKTLGP